MDKFSFQTDNYVIEFAINSCKYIIGDNVNIKYEILNILSKLSSNQKPSEYSETYNKHKSFMLNDKTVSKKDIVFIPVSQYFDYNESLKLKSDSLFLQLLKLKLKDIEFTETFMTLSILFKDFEDEINELLKTNQSINFNVDLQELNIKTLTKLLNLNLMIDDLSINTVDMSFEQNILSQLNVIYQLAEIDYQKLYIVYLDIPNETESIIEFLSQIDINNLKVIIIPKDYVPKDLDKILLTNKYQYDLADETIIYEKFTLEIPNCHSLKQTRALLHQYLLKKNTDETYYIKEILQ